jgi:hypothetical protein
VTRTTVASLRAKALESRPTVQGSRHPHAAAAEEMCAWLSWLELGGASPRTLYLYGWTVDKLLEAWPDVPFDEFSDLELLHLLKGAPEKSRARWVIPFRGWLGWDTWGDEALHGTDFVTAGAA